ncbi:membrane protein [Peribacillus loiseleuriae]|uniref:Membrane protein n=1 Tax=Peribacillus loiseleuriae TaxID=1679170 RepID=A0A0K9H038_9BACI|nr:membrane protein [Peribacillus loiseleuriae]
MAKQFLFILKFWTFLPFLKDFFISREVQLYKKVLGIVFMIGYVVFPFDLIPDFLSFLGIVDDLMIAGIVVNWMVLLSPETLKKKHRLMR